MILVQSVLGAECGLSKVIFIIVIITTTVVVFVPVKYGFIDTKSLAEFMFAFKQMQDEAKDSGGSHPTAAEKESLRQDALCARAKLREGKRLAHTNKQLSREQRELLAKLESGELEREAVAANQKYGYGEGVTRTSTEEAVLYRVSGNSLDDYHRGGDGSHFATSS